MKAVEFAVLKARAYICERSTSVAGVSAVHISLKPVSFPVTKKASELPLSILVKGIVKMMKAPARPAGFLHVDAPLHMPEHPKTTFVKQRTPVRHRRVKLGATNWTETD